MNAFKLSKTKLIAFMLKQMVSKIGGNFGIVKKVQELGMSGKRIEDSGEGRKLVVVGSDRKWTL